MRGPRNLGHPGYFHRPFSGMAGRRSGAGASQNGMLNAMPQVVTRLDAALLDAVDRLIADGVVASRSDAVRLGLEQLVERVRRAGVGASIVDGYRRTPQSRDELRRADEGLRALLAEESW
jgi:Arc/MetJ-type ribon-helix-helix transcriptional regulator